MKYRLKSPEEIVARLKKLIKKIEEHFKDIEKETQVSHSQFRIIFPIIKDKKGYSMHELSEMVGVDKAFVSRTIVDLENKEIVQRDKQADSNERNYKIILTEKAQEFIAEKIEKNRNTTEKWIEDIPEERLFNFIEVLYMLTD